MMLRSLVIYLLFDRTRNSWFQIISRWYFLHLLFGYLLLRQIFIMINHVFSELGYPKSGSKFNIFRLIGVSWVFALTTHVSNIWKIYIWMFGAFQEWEKFSVLAQTQSQFWSCFGWYCLSWRANVKNFPNNHTRDRLKKSPKLNL